MNKMQINSEKNLTANELTNQLKINDYLLLSVSEHKIKILCDAESRFIMLLNNL